MVLQTIQESSKTTAEMCFSEMDSKKNVETVEQIRRVFGDS